ncbi:hypothetical protein [Chryseobacterium wangxinyae]|uniref:hypothetical protein n=1 Tax=Chryseobacterium sp. CY353 TaxID=2997334 RepID=UPI00226EB309|nr:hypothetical protein [Chryseobacterium sp. CY353]MCY0969671.1 hypothetical protein [Chryseobacterium sp. CY353]
MKSKQELKKYFENGDKPTQEQFWEWQESYWHKDEKLKNTIPLSGTEDGENVTGDIALSSNLRIKSEYEGYQGFVELDNGSKTVTLGAIDMFANTIGAVKVEPTKVTIEMNAEDIGLVGQHYYGTTLTPNHFVQKKYVDDAITNSSGGAVYKPKGSVADFDALKSLTNMSEGDVYNLLDTGDNHVYVNDLNSTGAPGWDKLGGTIDTSNFATNQSVDNKLSLETLDKVVSRGNYTSKPIYFVDGDEQYTSLGMNPTTYSFNWGSMSKDHTGEANIAIGYYSMDNLTTGAENNAFGIGSLRKLTTGFRNTAIGSNLGNLTTGFKNTAVGNNAGTATTTGNLNTLLGYKANNSVNFGDKNIFIGANSAQGVTGSNNIMIGVGAGVNGGVLNNKLIIHSNHTLGGYSNTSEGNFTNPQFSYLSNALITGDFAEKWVKLNATLIVNGLVNAQSDLTFTKSLVAKSDGTLGVMERTEGIPLSGTLAGKAVSGKIEFSENASIESGTAIMRIDDGYISFKSGLSTGINVSQNQVFIRQGTEKYINMSNELDKIIIGSTGSGVDGANYYGDSYEDNSFVQKKYIDQKSSYSNNEETTGGQWIDGKPIYKKTIKFDTIPSSGEIDLTPHFRDVETIVSNQMFTEWYNMDVAFAGNQYRSKAFITLQPEMAKIEHIPNIDYDYSLIDSFTLTLEYTKRTL